MSDDFERAVLFSFDQSGAVEGPLRSRAATYLEGLRASPDVWRPCAQRFVTTAHAEVQFWCLQTLHLVRTAPPHAAPRVATVRCA
jgi:exportin-T